MYLNISLLDLNCSADTDEVEMSLADDALVLAGRDSAMVSKLSTIRAVMLVEHHLVAIVANSRSHTSGHFIQVLGACDCKNSSNIDVVSPRRNG
jgi:hypothetical protein